jgi:hypothetical protein
MVTIFVPDIPEFEPFIQGARNIAACTVREPLKGYWRIEAEDEICLDRKALGLGPALWNSCLTGGFRGRIVEYGRNVLRIVSATDLGA